MLKWLFLVDVERESISTSSSRSISISETRTRLTQDVIRYEGVSQLYVGKQGCEFSLSDIHTCFLLTTIVSLSLIIQ